MSQEEVLSILEKSDKPLARIDIAKLLNKNPVIISHAITQLIKFHEINFIEIDRIEAMKLYKCKRTMKLYYVSTNLNINIKRV